MSLKEQAKEHAKGVVSKVVGGVVGLVVAGGLMWFSPWVDRYIKPPKPLANFETADGEDALTVKFKNLSQNAKEARWDFGDASPIVTVPGDQAEVSHKFKKSGSYTVKLTVKNVAEQEDKREGAIAVGVKPKMLDLSVRAKQQKTSPYTAPVTVKFVATADLDVTYEWNFGDGYKPDGDTVTRTFDKPGTYTVRVRPVQGHQRGAPRTQEIQVLGPGGIVPASVVEPAPSTPGKAPRQATLSVDLFVRTQAVEENRKPNERLKMINLSGKAVSSDIEQVVTAEPGYVIKAARLEETTVKKSASVINLTTVLSDDRRSVRVRAQVSSPGAVYQLQAALLYQEEIEGKKPNESKGTLTLPGSLTLDLPPGRKLEFEVRYGGLTVFKQGQLPTLPANVSLDGRNFLFSATLTGQRVTVNVREVPRPFKQPGTE